MNESIRHATPRMLCSSMKDHLLAYIAGAILLFLFLLYALPALDVLSRRRMLQARKVPHSQDPMDDSVQYKFNFVNKL